jgi:mycothiol synthase
VPEGVPLATARAVSFDDAEAGQRIYQMRVRIHPAVRGSGLEAALASRLMEHIRTGEAEGNFPARDNVQLLAVAREEDATGRSIYESMGLKPERYSWTMERSLLEPIPSPKEVDGVLVRSYRRPEDDEAARVAYNNSFIDHYEFHAMPQEFWTYIMSRPEARPDLSWLADIAEGSDAGSIAGFCVCEVNEHDNARTGNKEGWIGFLGTIRGWRGIGLGKSLLLRGLHSLKDAGLDTALLGVDSQSPTGANRLYESVGFTVRNHEIVYKCPISEAHI